MPLLSQITFAQFNHFPSTQLSSFSTFLQFPSFFTEIPRTNLTSLRLNPCSSMSSSYSSLTSSEKKGKKSKKVWIWTKNKQVMTAAVERGWNTFLFPSHHSQLAHDWSCISLLFNSIISCYFEGNLCYSFVVFPLVQFCFNNVFAQPLRMLYFLFYMD